MPNNAPGLPEHVLPEPEDFGCKEVYAFFGLAAYWAQVLERGVINLAVGLEIGKSSNVTRQLVDELFARFDVRTLGRLLRAVQDDISVGSDDAEQLKRALAMRNRLAHTFFFEHSENFGHEAGRVAMLGELREMTREFMAADRVVDDLVLREFQKHGVTQEHVDREMAKVQARVAGLGGA